MGIESMRVCTVCAANNNRSMEAHKQLKDAGFDIRSFGTGSTVKLPGPSIDRPNVYEFGTPYEQIYQDLMSQEYRKMYEAQGLISMLVRNKSVKLAPEKWHNNAEAGKFDIVITCEERCFDSVLEDLMNRMNSKTEEEEEQDVRQVVHVINVDIKDDNENAKIGGMGIVRLVKMIHEYKAQEKERRLKEGDDDQYPVILEDEMMKILTEWQKDHTHLPSLYSVSYY
ncbi:RNA polymerase II subunit A C-terminal domain phosphatase SSU72 [Metschnikowia aff. pulcherrima]|uniref:RNA polymerase II subunit A C-terminal domain phosphatase SSU72 n=1 Tax=Metschnikowia aff. pulcherrima TaxID=2163413 RepID=A0A4P6XVY8_9ASCO|nr:RNA polymerase II subunit A C-terminal domain phosphatase SSU72 [Metschnikowia aff. pulcherrima]